MGRGHYERSADALWAHPSSEVPSSKGGVVRDILDVDKIRIDSVSSKVLPERIEKFFCSLSHHGLHGRELILPPLDRTSVSGVEVAPMPVNECFKPGVVPRRCLSCFTSDTWGAKPPRRRLALDAKILLSMRESVLVVAHDRQHTRSVPAVAGIVRFAVKP